jgi:hypothetical protein
MHALRGVCACVHATVQHRGMCSVGFCLQALIPDNGDTPLPFKLEPNDLHGREPANKEGRSLFDFDEELAKYQKGRTIQDSVILEFLENGNRRFTHPDPIPMKVLDWAGLQGYFGGDLSYAMAQCYSDGRVIRGKVTLGSLSSRGMLANPQTTCPFLRFIVSQVGLEGVKVLRTVAWIRLSDLARAAG